MTDSYCGVWHGKGHELVVKKRNNDETWKDPKCEKVCAVMKITQKCGCPNLYIVDFTYQDEAWPDEKVSMFRNGNQLQGEDYSGRGINTITFNKKFATLQYSIIGEEESPYKSLSGEVRMKKCECRPTTHCECVLEVPCPCACAQSDCRSDCRSDHHSNHHSMC